MHVVFVAAEMYPFSKVGGLADFTSALSAALVKAGTRVTAILPAPTGVDPSSFSLSRRLAPLGVVMGGVERLVEVYEGRLSTGVRVILPRSPSEFERSSLYTDGLDEPLRWGLFSRAALTLLAQRGEEVDIVHANDWHTALVPWWLEGGAKARIGSVARAGTVLTLHNLEHQGHCDPSLMQPLGIDPSDFVPERLEFWGKLNILKGGLLRADRVTTVSPGYAREITTAQGGAGLDGVIRSLPEGVVGILNGIDTEVWNPAADMRIPARYSADDPSGKVECKRHLQARMGLPRKPGVPLAGMITRLVAQKGVDLLIAMAPRMLRADVQLVVLGTGEPEIESQLAALASRWPDKVAYRPVVDEAMAHAVYAGSDVLAMPSRYEPCGLSQLIAMRYGTVPVVRRTGGLADTVVDSDPRLVSGNGFVFDAIDPFELLGAIQRAFEAYSDRDAWTGLVRRLMRADVSWDRSVGRYVSIYEDVISRQAARRGAR